MSNGVKVFTGILIVILMVIIIGGYFVTDMLKSSLPEYSGTEEVSGIKENIQIYFDSLAIPYIIAAEDEDAAFALGYLHAMERMFQMDVIRRAGSGKLSEIFGEETLPFDKMFRTVGIEETASKIWESSDEQTKKILKHYALGVNHYLSKKDKLPIEFSLLNYEPYEWTPLHSIIVIRMMAWELNISWWTDIAFSEIVSKVGREKALKLLPDYPENAPYIIPKSAGSTDISAFGLKEVDKQFRDFVGFKGTHIGSNSWAVNSSMSVSGKPVIANDPHLAYQAPGKWYAVVIRSKNWNAEGVSLPGVPGIVIGKNRDISWALTNVMADDADFYIENIDYKQKKYFRNNTWVSLGTKKETIKIKGKDDFSFEVYKTDRGPVVSNIHSFKEFYSHSFDTSKAITMRWTGNEISHEFRAFYRINLAKNWNDFREAVRYFSVPGQNFLYADKSDNIGYICGAKLPIRGNVSPSFIYDGNSTEGDWKGFVPYEDMPKLYNPSSGYVASANNKTVAGFGYHISNLWEPPSRIERIHELMKGKSKHSPEDFMAYQYDVLSPLAREVTGYILNAFKDIKVKDDNLKKSLKLFRKWDYKMDGAYQIPSVYQVFFNKLLMNTLLDDLGYDLYNEYCFVANIPYRAIIKMMREDSSIFDNVKTKETETRDIIIRKSLSDALTFLENNYGKDIVNWQWNTIHHATFRHLFSGENRFVDGVINIGKFGIGGDGTTLFNTEYDFSTFSVKNTNIKSNQFENVLGPSMRFIYDFAKEDQFFLVLTTGQSGHPLSNHYKDLTDLWRKGEYITVRTSPDNIKSLEDKLELVKAF
ncbi:MAG: penicillin acylase family protein [Ignavibacteriaceae bacterium]